MASSAGLASQPSPLSSKDSFHTDSVNSTTFSFNIPGSQHAERRRSSLLRGADGRGHQLQADWEKAETQCASLENVISHLHETWKEASSCVAYLSIQNREVEDRASVLSQENRSEQVALMNLGLLCDEVSQLEAEVEHDHEFDRMLGRWRPRGGTNDSIESWRPPADDDEDGDDPLEAQASSLLSRRPRARGAARQTRRLQSGDHTIQLSIQAAEAVGITIADSLDNETPEQELDRLKRIAENLRKDNFQLKQRQQDAGGRQAASTGKSGNWALCLGKALDEVSNAQNSDQLDETRDRIYEYEDKIYELQSRLSEEELTWQTSEEQLEYDLKLVSDECEARQEKVSHEEAETLVYEEKYNEKAQYLGELREAMWKVEEAHEENVKNDPVFWGLSPKVGAGFDHVQSDGFKQDALQSEMVEDMARETARSDKMQAKLAYSEFELQLCEEELRQIGSPTPALIAGTERLAEAQDRQKQMLCEEQRAQNEFRAAASRRRSMESELKRTLQTVTTMRSRIFRNSPFML